MADFNFNITVKEGTTFKLPVENTFAFLDSMVVSWSTSNGSAASGSDYVATQSGPVTVPFNGKVDINLVVNDDGKEEPEETFGLFVTITDTVGGVATPSTFFYTVHIPASSGSGTGGGATVLKVATSLASAGSQAIDIANNVNRTYDIKNVAFGIIEESFETSKWPSKTGALAGTVSRAGNVAQALSIVNDAYATYNKSGPKAAAAGAAKDLIIAAASGAGGRIIAGGAATAVTFVVGGTLAPVVVGVAAGYVASEGISWALKKGYDAAFGGVKAPLYFAAANAGDTFGPYTLGAQPSQPAWEYNADTGVFHWLKPLSSTTRTRLESQFGFKNKALKLTGDHQANKADVIVGGFANDTIKGLAADDVLFGKKGNDKIYGGSGKDVIDGGSGNDTLSGNASRDYLYGDTGNDRLLGGSGNDVLIGGRGRDIMTGGQGNDDFDFNSIKETGKTSSTRDRITDFSHGKDDIDLFTIDANTKASGNQKFKFIGTQKFHHKPGELHYKKMNYSGTSRDKTIVEGDVNGDGKADFQIELTGLKTLSSGDFIL